MPRESSSDPRGTLARGYERVLKYSSSMSDGLHLFDMAGDTFHNAPCPRAGESGRPFMCSILLVGYDLWLLQTRALILRETEAAVYTCRPDQLEEAAGDRQIDLVILCHSLAM